MTKTSSLSKFSWSDWSLISVRPYPAGWQNICLHLQLGALQGKSGNDFQIVFWHIQQFEQAGWLFFSRWWAICNRMQIFKAEQHSELISLKQSLRVCGAFTLLVSFKMWCEFAFASCTLNSHYCDNATLYNSTECMWFHSQSSITEVANNTIAMELRAKRKSANTTVSWVRNYCLNVSASTAAHTKSTWRQSSMSMKAEARRAKVGGMNTLKERV